MDVSGWRLMRNCGTCVTRDDVSMLLFDRAHRSEDRGVDNLVSRLRGRGYVLRGIAPVAPGAGA